MAKIHVHELVKELDVTAPFIYRVLEHTSHPVHSPLDIVPAWQVEMVRAAAAEFKRDRDPQPDHARPKRSDAYTSSTPAQLLPIGELSVLERVALKHSGGPLDPHGLLPVEVSLIKRTVREWMVADVAFATPAVLDAWLAMPLGPALAKQCLDAGLTPPLLVRDCSVSHRMRRNEVLSNAEAIACGAVKVELIVRALKREGLLDAPLASRRTGRHEIA